MSILFGKGYERKEYGVWGRWESPQGRLEGRARGIFEETS